MQRLPKEYQAKVIENAARSRYGYEGLNQAMTAAATGGLPGLLGYTGSELINEGVRKFTDSNSWGDLIYKGNSPVIKTLAEISNPGNILGGIGSTRSVASRYKPNIGNSYSVTPRAIKSLLTPSKYETISTIIPESPITGFTPKISTPDGFPYSFYETAYSTPKVKLLEAPTAAQRRAFEVLQGAYNDNLPNKYLRYKAPEEILITPRITTKLPYKKGGEYLESTMTSDFLSPYLQLNLADPSQGVNIYNFEDLSKLAQKAYDDSYKILKYLGKGNEAFLPKSEIKKFLLSNTLGKLKYRDPSLPINIDDVRFEYLVDNPEARREALKTELERVTTRNNAFNQKRKSLRQVRALKKLLEDYKVGKIPSIEEAFSSYPSIKEAISSSPQYKEDAIEYLKQAKSKFSSTEDIEKDVIKNLLLQRHRFIRGANLKKDSQEFAEQVFTSIPSKIEAGRSDFPSILREGKLMDAMYTSNSMGTGLGYSYPSIRDNSFPRIAIIGKNLEDLNLEGDVSTWWNNNRLFSDVPYSKDEIDFSSFYLHPAESTSPKYGANILSTISSKLPERYPGSDFLVNKALERDWFGSTKTLKDFIMAGGIDKFAAFNESDPFGHFLFIGPKGTPIPGYRILKLIDPTKEWVELEKGQKVTRMHEGKYSKGFSKGMKFGGFL